MIFACFALFFSKQISTADRTRKMVPIMAPNRGGVPRLRFYQPCEPGLWEGVGEGLYSCI